MTSANQKRCRYGPEPADASAPRPADMIGFTDLVAACTEPYLDEIRDAGPFLGWIDPG